jgi:hypothetical protein
MSIIMKEAVLVDKEDKDNKGECLDLEACLALEEWARSKKFVLV